MSLFDDVFGLRGGGMYICRCTKGPGRYGCAACGAPGWDPKPPPANYVYTTSNTTVVTHKIRPERPGKRVPAQRAEEV